MATVTDIRDLHDRSIPPVGVDSTSTVQQTLRELSPGERKEFEEFDEFFEKTSKLRIMVAGVTGAGKSTILNGLVGKKIFEVGRKNKQRVTTKVSQHVCDKYSIEIVAIDCPGLHDGTDNEKQYIQEMKDAVAAHDGLDLLLYCKRMDKTRADVASDADVIRKLTDALGDDIWKRTLFVLTFANVYEKILKEQSMHQEEIQTAFMAKKKELKEMITEGMKRCAVECKVDICTAGFKKPELCACPNWLSDFWYSVYKVLRNAEFEKGFEKQNWIKTIRHGAARLLTRPDKQQQSRPLAYTESSGSDEHKRRQQAEFPDHNHEEIHRLRSEVQKRDELVEDILQQKSAAEREIQNNLSRLRQQLRQREEENHQVRRELSRALSAYNQQQQLKDRELDQANRQVYDLQGQLRDEQHLTLTNRQETSAQLREKDAQIDQLQRRLHQAEADGLGSHLSQLQLQPQGKSLNVPRDEIRITEQIGYGAAGLVSKGIYQGQTVAVKQIHREILREKHIMDEFKREVGIMATIQHPNLVRFIAAVFDEEVDRLRDTPLLVLELLHTNLRHAYSDYNLAPTQAVSIFRDVAYALHYLHQHSEPIIHRDVSAPNVLLEALSGDSWRAKLSDFGSANFARHAKTLGVGAIVYTAPEMFPRDSPLSPMPRPTTKCDVFSYGIVLVEVITKTMPTIDNRHRLFSDIKERWRLMYDLIVQCADSSPDNRPTMTDVLNKLNRTPTA